MTTYSFDLDTYIISQIVKDDHDNFSKGLFANLSVILEEISNER